MYRRESAQLPTTTGSSGSVILGILLVLAVCILPVQALDNPVPVITKISPTYSDAGISSVTITVTGSSFLSGSVVQWDGVARPTTYVSATKLTVKIPGDDLKYPKTAKIRVVNPAPGGGTSKELSFTVKAAYWIKSIWPAVVELDPVTLKIKGPNTYWEVNKANADPVADYIFGLGVTGSAANPQVYFLDAQTKFPSSSTKNTIWQLDMATGKSTKVQGLPKFAMGLGVPSPTMANLFYYAEGKNLNIIDNGVVVQSLALPINIGGIDVVSEADIPFLLAISRDPGNQKVYRVNLDANGRFVPPYTQPITIKATPTSVLYPYAYTGIAYARLTIGDVERQVLYVTKDDGSIEPWDRIGIVDFNTGDILAAAFTNDLGIDVDPSTTWQSGTSGYLNYANPSGIDFIGGRLFVSSLHYWNKGDKWPPIPQGKCISGKKYEDKNGDGKWQTGEPYLSGWKIQIYRWDGTTWVYMAETTTDQNGAYQFCNLPPCTQYKLTETQQSGYVQTEPASGYHIVYLPVCTNQYDRNFGNKLVPGGKIIIIKDGTGCLKLPAGMVGWWPGDGTPGDLYNGNPGSLLNGATATGAGMVGQAFSLDGVDDAVQIPEAPGAAPLDGFSKLTLDAWVKPGTLSPAYQAIVSKYDTSQTNGVSYWLGLMPTGKVRFAVYTGWNGAVSTGWYADTIGNKVPVNEFSHIAGVWEGSNKLHIYVNGTEAAVVVGTNSGGGSGTTVSDNTVPVSIGRVEKEGGVPAEYFKGLIDEVEIFDRALPQPEIQSIVDAGSEGKCKVIFPYTTTGTPPLGSFGLLLGGYKVFDQIPAGTYTVKETPVPDSWQLKNLVCDDPSGGTTVDLSTGTATIGLAGGETVTCTYTNERKTGTYTFWKKIFLYWEGESIEYEDPDWIPADHPFTYVVKQNGNVVRTFTVKVGEPVTLTLPYGTYVVEEINIPENYIPGHDNHVIITVPGSGWTLVNVITYDLAIEKTGPECIHPGTAEEFTLTVTNQGPASVAPVVTDEVKVGDGAPQALDPVYQSGDTDGDGLVDPTETWIYKVTWNVPAGITGSIVNTATVQEVNYEEYDAENSWYVGGDRNQADNSDVLQKDVCPMGTYTLWKEVYLYWQGENVLYDDPDWIPADHPFTYDVKQNGNVVKTVTVKKGEQTTLTLPYGTYGLEENPIPEGYIPAWNNHVDITVPGSGFTLANVITFDLEITKNVPDCVHPGTSEEFILSVTNQGPASVVPVVTDTVEVNGNTIPLTPMFQAASDTDGDGLVDPGETWIYKVTWNVPAGATEPIVNTATVQETHHDLYKDIWHLGGDRNQGQPHPNSVDVNVPVCQCIPGRIDIQKKGDDVVKAGATIHYEYLVTNPGTTPLSDVSVQDDKAGSATYDSGDDGDNLLEPGETWVFKASMTAPAWSGDSTPLTNTATAKGKACGAWVTPDQASLSLFKFQLTKDVCRYYNYIECVQYQDPNTLFDMMVTKQGSAAGPWTFTFKEGSPLNLWLSAGTFVFTEQPKSGYTSFYPSMTKTFPLAGYPGTTWVNLINFDLSIDKSGPDQCVQPGSQVTYSYDVSNTGPAWVMPKVMDVINGAPAVEVTAHTVKVGDSDQQLESGETWTYSYTWTVPPGAQGQISDTASVVDSQAAGHTGGNWKGGEVPGLPNSDTFTITICQPTVTKSFDLECVPGGFETGDYVTYTQGWYKNQPDTHLTDARFAAAFPSGYVEIGIPTGSGDSAKFMSATAVRTYLDNGGGGVGTLPDGHNVDPGSAGSEGTFGHQVLTLTLNVGFSNAGITPSGLGDLIIVDTGTNLDGKTISEALVIINRVIGNGALPGDPTPADLNPIVSGINEGLDEGHPTGWAQDHLIASCVPGGATAYGALSGSGGTPFTTLIQNGLHYTGSIPNVVKGTYNVRFYYVKNSQETTLCTIDDENIQHSLTNYCLWPVS